MENFLRQKSRKIHQNFQFNPRSCCIAIVTQLFSHFKLFLKFSYLDGITHTFTAFGQANIQSNSNSKRQTDNSRFQENCHIEYEPPFQYCKPQYKSFNAWECLYKLVHFLFNSVFVLNESKNGTLNVIAQIYRKFIKNQTSCIQF